MCTELKTVVKIFKQALLIIAKALEHDHTSSLINYILNSYDSQDPLDKKHFC